MSNVDDSMVGELRASAEHFAADKTDHARTRALRNTLPGHDAAIWREIVELGWLGILVPEQDGGVGLGLAEMAAVIEPLETGLLSGPLIELAVLGARAAVHCQAGETRSALLSGAIDGSTRLALALAMNSELPELAVSGESASRTVSGSCASVAGGAAATHFLVPVRIDGELALVSFPKDATGVLLSSRWRADSSPLGTLALEQAMLADEQILARGGAAEAAIARAIDEARIIVSAGLLGLSRHMLDMTVEYLKVRKQFDKVIGSFQALQHKSVDLYIQRELAAATLAEALQCDVTDADALAIAALRAKARGSVAAARIGRESIQLHGAIGYTEEHDLGLYVKRAMTLSAWLGNATVQRRRYIEKGQIFG